MELRSAALKALLLAQPTEKAAAARLLHPAPAGRIDTSDTINTSDAIDIIDTGDTIDTTAVLHPQGPLPGRSERPTLVAPSALKRRSAFTSQGRAALLHAVAHIELNAINLALDAVWRFPGMPERYYRD